MKVHFKVTAWETYDISEFPEEEQLKFADAIQEGKIKTYGDMVEFFSGADIPDMQNNIDTFLESVTYMVPNENKGEHTVELSNDGGQIIRTNTWSQ